MTQVSGRLIAWCAFVLAFAALGYVGRFAGGRPPDDALYRWSTVQGGLIQFALIALIVWAIAGGGRHSELFALRRPTSWGTAAKIGVGIVIGMIVLTAALEPVLQPGEEQGLTPDDWNPDRAVPYVANSLVIAGVAPVVEELTFRGLGFSLLQRYGTWVAIVLVGIAFGLAHGLVQAFPFLAAFGAGLAYLRSRTGSVYPAIIVHMLFNTVSLVAAVAI